MRTKGKLRKCGMYGLHAGPEGVGLFVVGNTYQAPDASHIVACWNEIEAVGGDPALVLELVAAIRAMTAALSQPVQFTRSGGGPAMILRGDAAVARDIGVGILARLSEGGV